MDDTRKLGDKMRKNLTCLLLDHFKKINCKRINGGYVSHEFIIEFERSVLHIETNLRIRTNSIILLNFNDLWLNKDRTEMSDEAFGQIKQIENTLLEEEINYINQNYSGALVTGLSVKRYGDVLIRLSSNLIIEIINDTKLEGALIFEMCEHNSDIRRFCCINNNKLQFNIEKELKKINKN